MEVIKRVNSRSAWVRVDNDTAKLLSWDKDMKESDMLLAGNKIKEKRDRLRFVREEIGRLKK